MHYMFNPFESLDQTLTSVSTVLGTITFTFLQVIHNNHTILVISKYIIAALTITVLILTTIQKIQIIQRNKKNTNNQSDEDT